MANVEVNGRSYRVPERPTVVVCFDGCDPAYIRRGLADGILPTIAALQETGFVGEAEAVVPTFTNPNNASIVTGVPPAVHGISGNYYLDRATGEERMITDGALMRCGTILAAMAEAGVKTAAVTAKDKLRLMLARGLQGINFSSEKADRATAGRQRHRRCRGDGGAGHARPVLGRPVPVRARCRACGCWSVARRTCSICRCPTSCSMRMRRVRPRPMPSTARWTRASGC